MAKVFMRVMARRLGLFAEGRIFTEAQRGFRCQEMFRSVVGVEGVCVLGKREKKTSHLAFLDISKAYYSVWVEGLWCKMRHYGVEEKFVKLCEGLYRGVETMVVMNGAK